MMIQSYFKHLFATSVKYSDFKISPFVHKMAKIYLFRGRGFHTPVEWKIGYKVINKQTIIQILIGNTAFYIYGNMRLKEISILNSFELIQENIISDSAFFRLGSAARSWLSYPTFILYSSRKTICDTAIDICITMFTIWVIKPTCHTFNKNLFLLSENTISKHSMESTSEESVHPIL